MRFASLQGKLHRFDTGFIALIGVAIGFAIAAGFLPGGFDAYFFYLRTPPDNTPVPAWIYLLTVPVSVLGPPFSWQVLTFISVAAAGMAARAWGNRNWWVVVFSAPMLWNVWLGQIEVFGLLGLAAAWLILNRRAHPAWLGFVWLAFAAKPQVSLGFLLVVTWWVWRDQGVKAILAGMLTSALAVGLTLVIWPGWPVRWIETLRVFTPTWSWNAAVWPYGLAAISLAFIPQNISRAKRLRMVAAATLLAVPYFTLYHCTALLALTPSPLALLLSWLLVVPARAMSDLWMKWGWILPAAILLVDFVRCYYPAVKVDVKYLSEK